MGNNEPAVDQSDLRIRGSYGLNTHIHVWYLQQPRLNRFERKFADIYTTDKPTNRPTTCNNPSVRMRARVNKRV